MAESITITAEAAEEIRRIRKENNIPDVCGLRLGVKDGSCCGKSYVMGFDEAIAASDHVSEQHGLKVYVDAESLAHMTGATLGYDGSPESRGFYFTNPNDTHDSEEGECGCGGGNCSC